MKLPLDCRRLEVAQPSIAMMLMRLSSVLASIQEMMVLENLVLYRFVINHGYISFMIDNMHYVNFRI